MKRARDPGALKDAMHARGKLTTRDMAKLCGCSEKTVRNILAGQALNDGLARAFARNVHGKLHVLFVDADASDEQPHDKQEAVA